MSDSMFVYVLLLARSYICIFAYILANIVTYMHIFPLCVDGKEWDERREWEKSSVGVRGGNGLLQSEFLFLSNFMVGKGLFWLEYEVSVLRGI